MLYRIAFATGLLSLSLLCGCPPQKKLPAATPAPGAPTPDGIGAPDAAQAAKTKFESLCATCHGLGGTGDAPAAASFEVKPRDYTDPAWQDSVTDDYLAKVIVEGGAAVGKSPMMPGSPDLKGQPEVVAELVKTIRSFRRKN